MTYSENKFQSIEFNPAMSLSLQLDLMLCRSNIDSLMEECHSLWKSPSDTRWKRVASINRSVLFKSTEKSSADVARWFCSLLKKKGIPHAIGGALAYSYWALPRYTADVDMNCFLPANKGNIQKILDLAKENEMKPINRITNEPISDEEAMLYGERHFKLFFVERGGTPIDIFLQNEFDSPVDMVAAAHLRVKICEDVPLLDAESLALFKLLWLRPKDIPDLERLFACQDLDFDYIEKNLNSILADDDKSIVVFHNLKKQSTLLKE